MVNIEATCFKTAKLFTVERQLSVLIGNKVGANNRTMTKYILL